MGTVILLGVLADVQLKRLRGTRTARGTGPAVTGAPTPHAQLGHDG